MPETNLIKVRFLRDGHPAGREYTYETPVPVKEGDLVQVNSNSIGEVVKVNVSYDEVENFRDKLKCIVGTAREITEEKE